MVESGTKTTNGKDRMGIDHVLVAGGGSGGHVFPALAVAERLVERGWRVSWLGNIEGMERDLVEPRDMEYHALASEGVVGRSIPARVKAMTRLGISALQGRSLIRRLEVDVVLGTGGYVSVPGVMGATLAGRPTVLLEPNVEPGAANRWLSRWARVAAVASPEASEHLRCPVEETGIPVRDEFSGEVRPADLEGPLRLLILGGSQGARQLNETLPEVLQKLAISYPGLQVTHQVGARWVEEVQGAYDPGIDGCQVSIVPFLEDMQRAMSMAHLVISRAGAITLAEICAVGRAALLVPLSLADSHQVANAHRLVAAGGAEMLEPREFTPEKLCQVLEGLVSNRRRLQDMGRRAAALARPEAAARIADLVEKVARES